MSKFLRSGSLVLLVLAGAALGCSKEVRIGALVSETGGASPYGQKVMRGIDLAMEEINSTGGINGGMVEVVYRNDASNPEIAVEKITELIETEGIDVIIGGVPSGVTLRVAPICERKQVVLLSPASSAPEITQAGRFIFRNYPSDVLEGTAMADFAKERKIKKVVVVAVRNEFAAGLTKVFETRFAARTRKVVKTLEFDEGDASSFPSIVEEIKQIKPGGIYIAAYVNDMVPLLKALRGADVAAVVMASASVNEQLITQAGESAEYLVYPQPGFDTESTDPAIKVFVDAYRAKYREEPDIFAAHGYDALKLIRAGIAKGGTTHPDDVRRGLLAIDGYQGAAGRTSFDDNGDVVRYPQLFVIHEGKPVSYEEFTAEGGSLPIPDRG